LQVLVPEHSRKGFYVADSDGNISAFHATANQLSCNFSKSFSEISVSHKAPNPVLIP